MFRIGEVVRVLDGSWALELRDYNLEHIYGVDLQAEGNWTVVATECVLPADQSVYGQGKLRNNTIIKSLTHKRIVFIKETNLASVHLCNKCPHCGAQIKEK